MAAWDVAVVGAGILGCGAAWHLARRGLSVVVLDRGSQPGYGSTARSTAIIRQRYSHPGAMALAQEGLRTWERWADLVPSDAEGRRARLVRAGVLFLLPAGEPGTPRLATAMARLGIAVKVLDRDALAARFPALAFPAGEAVEGLFEPEGGFVDDPVLATQDAARAATAAGAQFLPWTEAAEVTTVWEDGRARVTGVRTDRGRHLAARAVLNCAGPNSAEVNLRARSPLGLATAPLRQRVVDAEAPELGSLPGPLPVLADLLNGFYARPDARRFRVGAVWPEDERDWMPFADAETPDPEPEWIQQKVGALRRRLPGVGLEQVRGLTGVYDVTVQDWYPVVDRTETEGYFVAIGTSGAWFKSGTVIGWLASELIAAWLAGRNTDLSPLEVALPITGHRFPLELFSRRRRAVSLEYGGGVLG